MWKCLGGFGQLSNSVFDILDFQESKRYNGLSFSGSCWLRWHTNKGGVVLVSPQKCFKIILYREYMWFESIMRLLKLRNLSIDLVPQMSLRVVWRRVEAHKMEWRLQTLPTQEVKRSSLQYPGTLIFYVLFCQSTSTWGRQGNPILPMMWNLNFPGKVQGIPSHDSQMPWLKY